VDGLKIEQMGDPGFTLIVDGFREGFLEQLNLQTKIRLSGNLSVLGKCVTLLMSVQRVVIAILLYGSV
jgi:hypothetical protein